MTSEAIRAHFAPDPGVAYLDAATYGLPPRATIAALQHALADWQSGRANWREDWDREGEACRSLFADLIGARPAAVALIPTVSVGVGMVAASLAPGTEVVVPDDEFTSVVLPLLVAQQARGVRVRTVPFASLAEAIGPRTDLVALSLVRSQSGETADLGEICAAARRHETQILIDATHAIPFVPVAEHLPDIDHLFCHGYKHLLCPRGVGFAYVRDDRWDDIAPFMTNWRSAPPRYERAYGGPLTLAADASRFDVSLAWHAWVGAKPSLELLLRWQREGAFADVLDLATRLATGLGLPPPTSSLVCLTVDDSEAAEAALERAGIRCAARGGNIRFSPHVYNTVTDIDRAVAAMATLSPSQGDLLAGRTPA
jgi:selenocysteine lyase/cysteine desulfurase